MGGFSKNPDQKGADSGHIKETEGPEDPGCGRMQEESEGAWLKWTTVPFTSIRQKERGRWFGAEHNSQSHLLGSRGHNYERKCKGVSNMLCLSRRQVEAETLFLRSGFKLRPFSLLARDREPSILLSVVSVVSRPF